MTDFNIGHLDHVAIRAKDLEISVQWYEKVLGLKRYQLPEWGGYPLFLLAGKTGVAIFPANSQDPDGHIVELTTIIVDDKEFYNE